MRKRIIALLSIVVFTLSIGVVLHAQEKPANVAGNWDLTTPGRGGTPNVQTMTIEQSGNSIKGTIKGGRGDAPLEGTVKGNNVTFSVKRTTPNGEITQEFKGSLDGSTLKGTVMMGPDRTVDWSATKAK